MDDKNRMVLKTVCKLSISAPVCPQTLLLILVHENFLLFMVLMSCVVEMNDYWVQPISV